MLVDPKGCLGAGRLLKVLFLIPFFFPLRSCKAWPEQQVLVWVPSFPPQSPQIYFQSRKDLPSASHASPQGRLPAARTPRTSPLLYFCPHFSATASNSSGPSQSFNSSPGSLYQFNPLPFFWRSQLQSNKFLTLRLTEACNLYAYI